MSRRLLIGFAARFVAVYGLLIAPWPGWYDAYGRFFSALNQKCWGHLDGNGLAMFRHGSPGIDGLDITVFIANRSMLDAQGKADAHFFKISSKANGLIPTALLTALVLATPVPWRRRSRSLAIGLFALHGGIFFILFIAMCRAFQTVGPGIGVFDWSPFWRTAMASLHRIIVNPVGTRLALAVFLWVVITIRNEDWRRWLPEFLTRDAIAQTRRGHDDSPRNKRIDS